MKKLGEPLREHAVKIINLKEKNETIYKRATEII